MTATWLLVAGDFRQTGGMDRANYQLAWYLAEGLGRSVFLVAHHVAEPLAGHPNVRVHRVPRPFGSHALGEPFLDWAGRRVAARLQATEPGSCVVVNGGNCLARGVNWVHYVHAAYSGGQGGHWLRRAVGLLKQSHYRAQERRAVRIASLLIANSERTRQDLVERLGVPAERVRVVYLASHPDRFRPPSLEERSASRLALGWPPTAPVVLFVGSPRDRRKGLDVVLSACRTLTARPGWRARLAVVGAGAQDAAWQRGLKDVQGLGLTDDVHKLYWASDVLVAPTRYEAYGLAVHEALCCGLPALVSRSAGIAERYPPALNDLILPCPENGEDLAARLLRCLDDLATYRERAASFGATLRSRVWDDVAAEIVARVEQDSQHTHQPTSKR
jgi:glycosyltransferase involved in cell wall biosynthesis